MNLPKLQFGKTEIAAEKLFVGVFSASMALCSGFYIWGMLFLISSQNQMELYLTKGVYLCGVLSLVSAALAVLLCLCVAAVIVPAVAAGTFEALRPICRELVDRVKPDGLGQGGGVLALPECATHSVRAPNEIVYQYGGEPLQSACIRLERRCQEVLASEIPAILWAPRGENLVKIYSRKSDGTIQSNSPTREEMQLPGIQYPADFVFASESQSQYDQFLSALCTAWDNNQTKYRAMREAQTGVDRFLSFAKAPSAVLNCVLFLLCLIPSVLSANIVSDVKAALPSDILFYKPDNGVSVVFQFENCPARRKADGKQTVSQLLESDPAFDADANFGKFISVSVGGRTYGAMPTSAAPKPLFERASASLPDSAQGKAFLDRADDAVNAVSRTGEQIARDAADHKSPGWILRRLCFLVIAALAFSRFCSGETRRDRFGRTVWGKKFLWFAEEAATWGGVMSYALMACWAYVFFHLADEHGDYWSALSYVFSPANLPLLVVGVLLFGPINFFASRIVATPNRDSISGDASVITKQPGLPRGY